jgi:hypothetical protein
VKIRNDNEYGKENKNGKGEWIERNIKWLNYRIQKPAYNPYKNVSDDQLQSMQLGNSLMMETQLTSLRKSQIEKNKKNKKT